MKCSPKKKKWNAKDKQGFGIADDAQWLNGIVGNFKSEDPKVCSMNHACSCSNHLQMQATKMPKATCSHSNTSRQNLWLT